MKSDLKALSADNNLFKYADDTTLLVPEHSAVDYCYRISSYPGVGNGQQIMYKY